MNKAIAIIGVFLGGIPALWGDVHFDLMTIEDECSPLAESYPFEFIFENKGENEVEMTEIELPCGCTKAKTDKIKYSPGEKGVLKGIFEIGTRKGRQQKDIILKMRNADSGKMDIVNLKLDIKIQDLVTIKPTFIVWKQGANPEPKEISIIPNKNFGVELVSIESSSKSFEAELDDSEGEGGAHILRVKPASTDERRNGMIKISVLVNGNVKRSLFVYSAIR